MQTECTITKVTFIIIRLSIPTLECQLMSTVWMEHQCQTNTRFTVQNGSILINTPSLNIFFQVFPVQSKILLVLKTFNHFLATKYNNEVEEVFPIYSGPLDTITLILPVGTFDLKAEIHESGGTYRQCHICYYDFNIQFLLFSLHLEKSLFKRISIPTFLKKRNTKQLMFRN